MTDVYLARHVLLVLRHASDVPFARRLLGKTWSERLFPLLIDSQVATGPIAGSWDPRARCATAGARRRPDVRHDNEPLSLEVYFRHLPIYDLPAAGK